MLPEILPLVVAHRAGSGRNLQQLLGLLKVLAHELKVGEHAVGNPDEAARGFENILRADDERGSRRANRGKLATEARSREAISRTSSEMGMSRAISGEALAMTFWLKTSRQQISR